MSVSEIYNRTIKPLSANERLSLAKLILDEIEPDLAQVRDLAHLEELLLEGLNSGPAIEADDAFWEQRKQRLLSAAVARGVS